ncbi:MAG: helix-turn-helix transcriptional regulator [Sedimentisphaerales bacterium]|jgi:DNA-binding phage protein
MTMLIKSDNPVILLLTNNNSKRILRRMLIELLRTQIKTCGKSLNQIGRETGIDKAALSRITRGGSCKAETVEALLKYFGFEIVPKEPKKRTKRG